MYIAFKVVGFSAFKNDLRQYFVVLVEPILKLIDLLHRIKESKMVSYCNTAF